MAKKETAFSFDNSLAEVEQIIGRLQDSVSESLDKDVADVKRAAELIEKCRAHLTKTAQDIDKLFEDKD